jgi:hypothetical protein
MARATGVAAWLIYYRSEKQSSPPTVFVAEGTVAPSAELA